MSDQADHSKRSGKRGDTREMETIASVLTDVEASIIAAALRERGIEAYVVGGSASGFRAEAPGNALIAAPKEQADEARRLFVTIREEAKNIDWSQVDLGSHKPE